MNNHRFPISNKTTESSYLLAVVMVAVNQFTGFGDRKICECSAKPLNKGNNYSQEIKNPNLILRSKLAPYSNTACCSPSPNTKNVSLCFWNTLSI